MGSYIEYRLSNVEYLYEIWVKGILKVHMSFYASYFMQNYPAIIVVTSRTICFEVPINSWTSPYVSFLRICSNESMGMRALK